MRTARRGDKLPNALGIEIDAPMFEEQAKGKDTAGVISEERDGAGSVDGFSGGSSSSPNCAAGARGDIILGDDATDIELDRKVNFQNLRGRGERVVLSNEV